MHRIFVQLSFYIDLLEYFNNGLGGRVRTCDLLLPKQAFYQTELHRVTWCPGRDSNPQNSDFESDTYTNSITWAILDAGNGIEPLCRAYETLGQPLAQPAFELLMNFATVLVLYGQLFSVSTTTCIGLTNLALQMREHHYELTIHSAVCRRAFPVSPNEHNQGPLSTNPV